MKTPLGTILISRRRLLAGAAVLAATPSALSMTGAKPTGTKSRGRFAYVGTNTGAPGTGANGKGIYLFEMDPRTGALSHGRLAAEAVNPSWLAIHPSGKYLYAVSQTKNASGAVNAFSIDRPTGDLRFLNSESSHGAGPAHLSVDHSGKYVFVANYDGGSIAVLPIGDDGTVGAATDVHRDTGSLGKTRPTNAPRGSFAWSGHDAPHAHMILPDPDNRFVLQTDLGQDRIYVYKFDSARGKLTPAAGTPFVSLPTGDGPRHLAFHPNTHWLYSIQEEASTIEFFHYDPATGSLAPQQMISTLPEGFAGTSFTAEILVSADGKFLYASNRLHDTIAVFSIGKNGVLKSIGWTSTLGDYPSQFNIDPSGNFLYSCNQHSDAITSFRIHRQTGLLTFTGQYTPVGTPGSIVFL